MPLSEIEAEHEVFVAEGEVAVGAVRSVAPDHLVVWIESHGEERITADQIVSAHDGKVLLRREALSPALQERLPHVHDGEIRGDPGR